MSNDHHCNDGFLFPRKIHNRPGLSHIQYCIGNYTHFRESMLRALNQEQGLSAWTHRAPDDPGIALLEGAAIIGDILCFYQDLYANEAFLRTAKWRESVADLVRLTDYQLSPGLGGRAAFAFIVKGDQPVTVPAGFPLKAQLAQQPQPVDFETVEQAVAFPGLSLFHLYQLSTIATFPAKTSIFTAPTRDVAHLKLAKKDRLILMDTATEATEKMYIVLIKDISQHFDRTRITIEGHWEQSGFSQITAFKLGRTFRHFGHNAPREVVISRRPQNYKSRSNTLPESENIQFKMASQITEGLANQNTNQLIEALVMAQSFQIFIIYNRKLDGLTKSGPTDDTIIDPAIGALELPLNNEIPDLAVGSKLVIQGIGNKRHGLVRTIKSLRSGSMTWGALSGATTVVGLDEAMGEGSTDIRHLAVHETIGHSFILQGDRLPSSQEPGPLDRLHFFGNVEDYQALNGRNLVIRKEDGTWTQVKAQTEDAHPVQGELLRAIRLDPPLPSTFASHHFPLENPVVTVFGNMIEATQGKTQKDTVLGNGDSRQTFQTFQLPKSPITWLNAWGVTPPEVPELEIYVDGIRWDRVSSFFGTGPDQTVYIVRQDSEERSFVQFGDGTTGKRLPSGIKNVIARYRTGTGAFGPLEEGVKVQAAGKLKELQQVHLPGIVSGGSLPEAAENAKSTAPGRVRSLNRLVALEDFETEALSIPGVDLASASWGLVENSPAVLITLLMETGREKEFLEVQEILQAMNRCRGPQRYPVVVVEGKRSYVFLSLKVSLVPGFLEEPVMKEVREALGVLGNDASDQGSGLFSLASRSFGQPAYANRVEGVVQNIDGVRQVKVQGFFLLGVSNAPETVKPEWLKYGNLSVVHCPNDRLLALHPAHLQLTPVSEPASEVCS